VLQRSMPETDTRHLADGATTIVEGDTAEAAIDEVHRRFGPDARIVEARRALKGGVGGFFARERVELHVALAPAPAGVSTAARAVRPPAEAVAPVDRLLDAPSDAATGALRLETDPSADLDGETEDVLALDGLDLAGAVASIVERGADASDEVDFATYLRRQLRAVPADAAPSRSSAGPTSTDDLERARTAFLERTRSAGRSQALAPDPAGDVVPAQDVPVELGGVPVERLGAAIDAVPVPFAASPDGPVVETVSDGPAWSTSELLRLGVPVDLVRSLAAADGDDDLGWTTAIAEAVRPLCRPLPVGASVLVGPLAYDLAGADALEDAPAARSDRWRAALGAARWTHLVVGGDGWRHALRSDVLAVSWTRAEDLPEALRCAAELGLVLGCGPLGGAVRRATPLDVALELRALVAAR
jgi:hypothetical protein